MKIVHFTTVHPRYDVRVFFKQCSSLANMNNEVSLYVADGFGGEVKNNVQIIDIGDFRNNRLKRLTKAQRILKIELAKSDADIYQFHDPELLSVGKWLKKQGKTVIYDSHEDVTKQILYKSWLGPLWFRKIIAKQYNTYQQKSIKKLDGVISVIDEITEKLDHPKRVTIRNFPIISFIEKYRNPIDKRKNQIMYLGSLSKVRGVRDYIEAMEFIPSEYRLVLVGSFSSEEFETECKKLPNWDRVDFLGFQPMDKSISILAESKVALSVLHPEKNYLTSLPTKGFEYMAAGVPTVISDFDYWRPFFKDCMLMVEPKNPKIIADNINRIINDEKVLNSLVEKSISKSQLYSWEKEVDKLVKLYLEVLKK